MIRAGYFSGIFRIVLELEKLGKINNSKPEG
jgi:hypothetical protein